MAYEDELMTQMLQERNSWPRKAQRAIQIYRTGELPKEDDLIDQMVKLKTLRKEESPEYVVSYDQEGRPTFTAAPGRIKNAPFYSSPQGREYYPAKTQQAQAQGAQATTETEFMNMAKPQVEAALSGQRGQVTPGTTISAGPINIPLNPSLTEAESRGFAAAPLINNYANEFLGYVQKGVMGSGDLGSMTRGLAIDSDQPWTTHPNLYRGDRDVQAAQSSMLRLKNATVFSDAGKQLTGTEKGIVFALLKTSGKTPEQISVDIPMAIKKFDEFVAAKKGGMYGYQPMQKTPSFGQTQVFNSPEEADASGLQPGMVVSVQGRRYQI